MSQQMLPLNGDGPDARSVEIVPGAVWLPGWLGPDDQVLLASWCRSWAEQPAGIRRPRMRDGTPFNTMAVCLGWHWQPYRYSTTCDDNDGAPVKPFPDGLRRLGRDACESTGFEPVDFDAAIVNFYRSDSKLGLHQDNAEGDAITSGSPVVTISLGDTCVFRFGNSETRSRPYTDVELASGDLFVFGGPARMAFHGVPKVRPTTGPGDLGVDGRISITLRESGMAGESGMV